VGARLERARKQGDNSTIVEVSRELASESKVVAVAEHPKFRSLQGYVACLIRPAKLNDARQAFEYCLAMRNEPDFQYLRAWMESEKEFGTEEFCQKAADIVLAGRSYTATEIAEMKSRKAQSLFRSARLNSVDSPSKAFIEFRSALQLHLECFAYNVSNNNEYIELAEKLARNTAYSMLQLIERGDITTRVDALRNILLCKDVFLDPIEEPICQNLRKMSFYLLPKGALQMVSKVLKEIEGIVESGKWIERQCAANLNRTVKSQRSAAEKEILRQQ
jgi:hypothetical protein